jgi:hypothetical protein
MQMVGYKNPLQKPSFIHMFGIEHFQHKLDNKKFTMTQLSIYKIFQASLGIVIFL